MFLFDTDHLSIIQIRSQPEYARISARTLVHPATSFYFPIVSFHEQASGWIAFINRARDANGVIRGYRMLEHLLSDFSTSQIASYESRASSVFQSLRSQRIRVGTLDLRIAAIAPANDYTVLSRNLADFRQVPGLRVEDWTA